MDQATSIEQMAPRGADGAPEPLGVGFREFVGLIAAMMAMMALGIDTMLPALPAIGGSLGVHDENAWQWIVGAYVASFGVAQLFYGPISDRFGRRPLMLGGIIGYALGAIGVALSPTFATLLVFRALQGASIAATRVVSISLVRDCYSGRQMARVMSLATIVFLAVPVLAPSIGQIVMLVFPWRWLFVLLALYGAIIFVWVALRLPETLHPRFRRAIEPATVLSAMRIALTTRQACGYMIVQALMQGAMLGFISSIEQIFADQFHAARLMPPMFALMAGMMAIASLLNSRVVERLGTRRVSHGALLGYLALQIVHLAIAMSGHETMLTFTACQGLSLFCFGLVAGNAGAMAMEPLGALAGTAASVQGFVMVVGGSPIGFAIGQAFDGTTVPLTIGFAITAFLALAVVLVTEKGKLFHPRMGD